MVPSIFLSSTFSDFINERQIIKGLLPCIDVHVKCAEDSGIYYMQAIAESNKKTRDEKLRKIIKYWIDQCEMVILLICNRYGTESDSGESWTSEEFNYAISENRIVLPYLRECDIDHSKFVDIDKNKSDLLKSFITNVENYCPSIPRYKFGENARLMTYIVRDVFPRVLEIKTKIQYNNYYDAEAWS
jgi:hypothetical protein